MRTPSLRDDSPLAAASLVGAAGVVGLAGLVGLVGCSGAVPPPREPPAPAAPYREQTPAMSDSFTFWGWSDDGRRFAYEAYSFSGGEPLDCADEATLLVRDAVEDELAPGGERRIQGGGQEPSGRCRVPDVRAALDRERDARLAAQQIRVGGFLGPSRFTPLAAGGFSIDLGPPRTGHARLLASASPQAPDAADPAVPPDFTYRLLLSFDRGGPRELGSGPLPGAIAASLDDALAFFDLQQRSVAVCLPVTYAVTHGTWTRWACHGLPLRR